MQFSAKKATLNVLTVSNVVTICHSPIGFKVWEREKESTNEKKHLKVVIAVAVVV